MWDLQGVGGQGKGVRRQGDKGAWPIPSIWYLHLLIRTLKRVDSSNSHYRRYQPCIIPSYMYVLHVLLTHHYFVMSPHYSYINLLFFFFFFFFFFLLLLLLLLLYTAIIYVHILLHNFAQLINSDYQTINLTLILLYMTFFLKTICPRLMNQACTVSYLKKLC